jgi:hypothetical protein
VVTPAAQNELDQYAQAALAKVRLGHFAAKPSTIEPFTSSKISWEVAVPDEFDVSVDLDINGTSVATSGEVSVAPTSTTSYRLRARALNHARELGTVTAHVDLGACVALSAEPVEAIAAVITTQIETDTSGLYFRPTSYPYSVASIKEDRMVITLRLAQELNNAPNPAINIDASFKLDVIPIARQGRGGLLAGITPFQYQFHQLAPANEEIDADVSFPWYVWLVPGAMIALPIAISNAEEKARAKATKMISNIVHTLNGWFHQSHVQPPKMDKHDAGFYVNPQGERRFWINFCPVPDIITVSEP